jgi:hypothetical protein
MVENEERFDAGDENEAANVIFVPLQKVRFNVFLNDVCLLILVDPLALAQSLLLLGLLIAAIRLLILGGFFLIFVIVFLYFVFDFLEVFFELRQVRNKINATPLAPVACFE